MDIEAVFHTYYRKLCHFAWQLTMDSACVEDIVQEVIVYLWNHQGSLLLGDERALQSYLYTAVRHACYNHVRHHKVHLKYLHQATDIEELPYVDQIIRAEVVGELVAAIDRLPQACKKVVQLGYLEGLSNLEIAEQLNISVNTVKTQKQRALKALKGMLNPELYLLICYFLS